MESSRRDATPVSLLPCLLACALAACSGSHGPGVGDSSVPVADSGVHATPDQPELPALRYASGGQRLRARYYVADGAEKFVTLFDDQLGFACDFVPDPAGDGVHCVPSQVFELLYFDSACTEPGAAIQANDADYTGPPHDDWVSAFVGEAPAAPCKAASSASRATYRFGEKVFVGGQDAIFMTLPQAYALHAGKCEATAVQTGLLQPALYRMQLQDPIQLVAGAVSTLALQDGLSVRRVDAEDGAQITLSVLGRDESPCDVQPGGACVAPLTTTESGGFYLDDQCQSEAFLAGPMQGCDAAKFGVRKVDGVVHVYELVPAHDVFVKNTLAAAGTASGSAATYSCDSFRDESSVFAPGKDITATFAHADTLRSGDGELHLNRFVGKSAAGSNGERAVWLDAGDFVDGKGHSCTVEEAVDGSLRCLAPSALGLHETSYFSDRSCTKWLYEADDPAADATDLRLVERGGDTPPWKLTRLFSLKYDAMPYHWVGDGPTAQCVQVTTAPPSTLLVKDQEVPIDSLPRVELVEL